MIKSEKAIVDAAFAPLEFFGGLGDDTKALELFSDQGEERCSLNSILVKKLIRCHFALFSTEYKAEVRYSLGLIISESRNEIFNMIDSCLLPFFVPEKKLGFFKDLWSIIFNEYDYNDSIQISDLSVRTQAYKFKSMEEHGKFYDNLTWLIEM